MDYWYQSTFGQRIQHEVETAAQTELIHCFGLYAIQMGCPSVNLLDKSRVKHQFKLNDNVLKIGTAINVQAQAELLPIANDSVDLVILMHRLVTSKHPHALLREVDRVLIPEGKLVIIEINPFSFWGLRLALQSWLEKPPWVGHMFSAHKLDDWLNVLGFRKLNRNVLHFGLPFNSLRINKMSTWLAKAQKRWLPLTGAMNFLVYEKAMSPLTPIKSMWKKQVIGLNPIATPYAGRHNKRRHE